MTLPGARSIIAFTAAAIASLAAAPHAAAADSDTRTCVAAVERGQILHRDGKLRRARDEFITCARDTCPGPVRRDCAHWLTEVDASLPSVVFAPKLRDGRELRQGRIFFDGEPLRDALNGRAVMLDPGAHTLRLELDGAKPLTIETVIHEGEKNRLIAPALEPIEPARPSLEPPRPASADTTAPANTAAPPRDPQAPSDVHSARESPRRPIPVAAYITGSTALVGLAGFAYFGLKGRSELSDLRSSCGPHCPQGDVDSARQKLLAGDLFLAAGLVAAGITTWIILTRPTVHAARPDVAFGLHADPRGGAAAELRAHF